MAEAAVILDVDGVLLELTPAEEDAFFLPFAARYGLTGLSRDWDSYEVRNDEAIIAEILARHGLPASDRAAVAALYLETLKNGLAPRAIPGASELLDGLAGHVTLGIATANLREAARLRLDRLGLWTRVSAHAFGADGGGHKAEIVARAIASVAVPVSRIVYVGDNLNDLEAGRANGVHFIGFSADPVRRARLAAAGARHTSADHVATAGLIAALLATA